MIRVIKKLNFLLDERQKGRIVILFFIMLLSAFLETLSVSVMIPVVTVIVNEDVIYSNEYISRFCTLFSIDTYRQFVVMCILTLVVLYIAKNLFLIFQNYIQGRFVCNNRLAMQKRLLNIIINRPYDYFLNVKTGEVSQMINRDPSSAYSLLSTLLNLTADVVVSLALGITVLIIEPQLTLFMVVVLLVSMTIITKIARPKIQAAGMTVKRSSASAGNWCVQIVNGIKEIKVAHKEDYFVQKYTDYSDEGIKAEKLYITIGGIPRALIEMVSICTALIVILVKILNGQSIDTMLPSLTAFGAASMKLLPCSNKIANAFNDIAYQEPFLDMLIENIKNLDYLQNNDPVIDEETGEEVSIVLNKSVEMDHITFRYPGTDKLILDGGNLQIPIGQSIGIVGPSGAGKSTTADILMGLLRPESGTIYADGIDVKKNYKEWLSHIAYIPQTIFILDASIRENVAFGVPKEDIDDERVWKALREAQLEEYVKSQPKGLDSRTGERGIRISGGQRQRLSIARALYTNPELIVFDEATSSLDNETEAAIMESINMLHGKKTLVIIAHRLQTIEGCDMIYRVENGKITRER